MAAIHYVVLHASLSRRLAHAMQQFRTIQQAVELTISSPLLSTASSPLPYSKLCSFPIPILLKSRDRDLICPLQSLVKSASPPQLSHLPPPPTTPTAHLHIRPPRPPNRNHTRQASGPAASQPSRTGRDMA